MESLLAGAGAAVLAWLFNPRLLERTGQWGVMFAAPLLEEILKTGLALLLGASFWVSHLVFGVIEGIYDLKVSRFGLAAAACSVAGHLLFGLAATVLGKKVPGVIAPVAGGTVLHWLWNVFVLTRLGERGD